MSQYLIQILDCNSFHQTSRLFLNELAFQSFLSIFCIQDQLCRRWRFSMPVGGLMRKSTYINMFRWIDFLLQEDKDFCKLNSPQPLTPTQVSCIRHLMVPWEVKQLAHGLITNKLHFTLQPMVPRMELRKMPHIHAPGVLRKTLCWQLVSSWVEAWEIPELTIYPLLHIPRQASMAAFTDQSEYCAIQTGSVTSQNHGAGPAEATAGLNEA